MSKRFPLAKWVLPEVVKPPTSTCFMVPVPDDRNHRGAFMGAMLSLASAYKWQDDADHTAIEVAKVWRNIFYQLTAQLCAIQPDDIGTSLDEDISMQIRISPDDSCIIQMWCIDHWEDWYNPKECIASGATQPPPSSAPEVGECKEYFVTMNARDQWLLPFPVSEGYEVTISGMNGGWNDGTINWFCPNGGFYTLGACGSPSAPVGTDPMPGLAHMRLIGRVGASGYFDAADGFYTIPIGVVDEPLYFQSNDDTLSDNQGSISFTVSVCAKEQQTWCYEYNFEDVSGSFLPFESGGTVYGTWVPGLGWTNYHDGGGSNTFIRPNWDMTNATHVEYDLLVTATITGSNHTELQNAAGTVYLVTSALSSGLMELTWDGANPYADLYLNAFNGANEANALVFKRFKATGKGAPPNGPSNC